MGVTDAAVGWQDRVCHIGPEYSGKAGVRVRYLSAAVAHSGMHPRGHGRHAQEARPSRTHMS